MRLIRRGLSSKQIATERKIRPDSVDRIVLAARQKLGSLPRHEAARLYAEYEARQNLTLASSDFGGAREHLSAHSRGAPRSGLSDPTVSLTSDPVEQPDDRSERGTMSRTEDSSGASHWHTFRSAWFGADGSQRNDLDILSTAAAIAITAAGAASVVAAVITLLDVVDRFAIGP